MNRLPTRIRVVLFLLSHRSWSGSREFLHRDWNSSQGTKHKFP